MCPGSHKREIMKIWDGHLQKFPDFDTVHIYFHPTASDILRKENY